MAMIGGLISRFSRQVSSVTSQNIRALTIAGLSRKIHSRFVAEASNGVVKEDEDPKSVTDDQWKTRLTSEQYYICRRGGTEAPFTGDLLNNKKAGIYHCTCCGAALFSSKAKYDSGSGWPSFYEAVSTDDMKSNVLEKTDTSHGMMRTEVLCKQCHAHLGHVFNDGPLPTRQRFCINSVSISFHENNPNKDD